MKLKYRKLLTLVSTVAAVAAAGAPGLSAAETPDRLSVRGAATVPSSMDSLRLDTPLSTQHYGELESLPKMSAALVGAAGETQVIVRLSLPSVGRLGDVSPGVRASQKANIDLQQSDALSRFAAIAPDMRVIARTQLVLNAVFVEVDAAALPELAKDPAVTRIAPVANYELDLSETVPYIGAADVQAAGFDGSGVKVAVLDSGIDYTHAKLGGGGTAQDYADAWGLGIGDPAQTTRDGLFPTDNVVEGYDFVGELWPTFGPLAPDPDPIDFEGHGTHVADIIGGSNGVAPGVDLYAVKVCSAVSSSCSGIALIQGMEFAVDPNGDGDPSDRVDIINMSLGAGYGQPFDDDLSQAVEAASALGVLTVSSAGNCGDLPYCTGTPSSAPTALSVAQTQVPSATAFSMNVVEPESAAGLYNAVKYPWTPDPVDTTAPVVYGDGAGGNLNGCAPFTTDLSGFIVAVDRGACFFSDKIRNIENAGGLIGIVMLVAPGAPFPGGFGGGPAINIPGFNISQADGDILRAGNAVVQFGPSFSTPLVGTTVSSTARGPDMSFNAIKPEIGAPGASVSAEATTGTGETPFGGTSGASPMVAGSAALLKEACPGCSPLALKSLLVNNAYRDIISDTTGDVAEITRIGGGEVRVNQALGAPFWAYSPDDNQPSIGLGLLDADQDTTIIRQVRVINLSGDVQQITVTPTFRFQDDADSGAISVETRSSLTIGKGGQDVLTIKFHVDADALPANFMNSGSGGNNPAALSANELDGYLLLASDDGEIALPWHVLARKAANVDPARDSIVSAFPDSIALANGGAGIAQNDAYAMIALSDEMPRGEAGNQSPIPDIRAVGVNTFPVPAGFCSAEPSFIWAFAVNTWDRQTHLVPVSHQIILDTDRDGAADYVVLNRDLTFNNISDGRQVTWALDLATGGASAFFFAEHSTNTGNTALYICGEQVGLTGTDMLATNVDAAVFAQDFYYGGPGDFIDGITITPLGEQYFGVTGDLAPGEAGTLDVYDFGTFPGNSPELGVLMFTNGDRGTGARGAATEDTEALLFLAPGVNAPRSVPPGLQTDFGR